MARRSSKVELDARARDVLELRNEGLTFREIGERLGVPAVTAQTSFKRAIREELVPDSMTASDVSSWPHDELAAMSGTPRVTRRTPDESHGGKGPQGGIGCRRTVDVDLTWPKDALASFGRHEHETTEEPRWKDVQRFLLSGGVAYNTRTGALLLGGTDPRRVVIMQAPPADQLSDTLLAAEDVRQFADRGWAQVKEYVGAAKFAERMPEIAASLEDDPDWTCDMATVRWVGRWREDAER